MSKFDKLIDVIVESLDKHKLHDELKEVKESSFNLYTDILNPLHTILNVDEDVSGTLENVDELVQFLIQKNPSIQNDLIEFVKSKSM